MNLMVPEHAALLRPTPREKAMADALRMLAVDAVEKARSGHPGAPMGMAEMAHALWTRHLKHNPGNPHWPDRDRFVLSNGHGSMLLYGLLHLTGYDLCIEDLRQFRQLHSKTPGHPEVGITPGVETTTGPLGQGLANAVGMALAESLLAREFNRDGFDIVDHYTFAFLGDGCLMEGISHEAASLAGALRLNKLVCLYDDNGISIDGRVKPWFSDDTPARFAAYGWQVIAGVDGHDTAAVGRAIARAKTSVSGPTLICCRTMIGQGSPNKAGSHEAHGAPLGAAEVAATRAALGWSHGPFEIPAEIYAAWDARARGSESEAQWRELFDRYRIRYPELAAEFARRQAGDLPSGWHPYGTEALAAAQRSGDAIATRKASQNAIERLAALLPEMLGGSADLTGSNLTDWKLCRPVRADHRPRGGNYVNYGVREFAMAGIMNGVALHGGHLPFGGTFLTFSDYSRNAIRMAALMRLRVIHVLTHDSIGLGEDGPTHQPIEHVSALRVIPNLHVWRPCDAAETMAAWLAAVERRDGPTCLVLSRQNLPAQQRTPEQTADIRKGGYVLADCPAAQRRAVLIATGSEVALTMAARAALAQEGIGVRVVSMPSTQVFDAQDEAYRDRVMPADVPRIAIEAGRTDFWRKYVGLERHGGHVIGVDCFGESAPAGELFAHFGLTAERVVATIRSAIASHEDRRGDRAR
jgi:transketolase